MKRVKFTLGLVLSLLFAGASVGNAQWEYKTRVIVNASQHYANPSPWNGINSAIEYRDYFEKGNVIGNPRPLDPPPPFPYPNIPENPVNTLGGPNVDIKTHSLYWDFNMWNTYDANGTVAHFLNDGYNFYQEFTVKLNYKNGKDVIPFLKRSIVTIVDDEEVIVVQDLLLAYSVVDKTQFTDGSGVATYVYKVDVLPFLLKYEVATVFYEIWVDEEISNNPGSGNAYPTIPRAVTIYADEGITTTPHSGMTQYVEAYKDFTFEVSGDPDKELDITTNNPNYAINKGITVTETEAGKWTVKISKVYIALDIKVSYKATTESNDGNEEGPTGNSAVPTDIVKAYGGTLSVSAATPGSLAIYSITGQTYEATYVNGSYSISTLPKGYYIVKLNGKAYKVVIN
jgi:hypothetical protein